MIARRTAEALMAATPAVSGRPLTRIARLLRFNVRRRGRTDWSGRHDAPHAS